MQTGRHIAQRNLCVSLVRKAKLDHYNRLSHKEVSDNKAFWKTVKPLFTVKESTTTESC